MTRKPDPSAPLPPPLPSDELSRERNRAVESPRIIKRTARPWSAVEFPPEFPLEFSDRSRQTGLRRAFTNVDIYVRAFYVTQLRMQQFNGARIYLKFPFRNSKIQILDTHIFLESPPLFIFSSISLSCSL